MAYSVVDLGELTSEGGCTPLAISPSGQLVTGTAYQTEGFVPFLWQSGDLEPLPAPSLYPYGTGYAINAQGDVAGNYRSNPTAAWPSHAFLKKRGAALFDIHAEYFGDSVASIAFGVNDDDAVVGIRYELTLPLQQSAWVYSRKTMTNLTQSVNPQIKEVRGINNAGLVVGRLESSQAFSYDASGTLTLLPLEVETREIFVNDAGQIAGNLNDGTIFIRQPDGTILTLASPDGSYIELSDFNNRGQVVGGNIQNNDDQVFVSDPVSATATTAPPLRSINPQIVDAGWVVRKVRGIDDNGLIVGVGRYGGGEERGVLLTAPSFKKEIYQAEFVRILFGIINDGPGVQVPGGKFPGGPEPGPVWNVLTAGQRDALLGLALNVGSSMISEKAIQAEMEALSARLVRSASHRLGSRPSAERERTAIAAARRSGVPDSVTAYLQELRRQLERASK